MKQNKQFIENNSMSNIRSYVEELWLKIVRLYTYNTPISKGKYRLFLSAMKFCRYLPTTTQVKVKDGRKLSVNLTTGMQETVYFLGEFENVLTQIVSLLIRDGDICIDAGANFGWYSTLCYKHCGENGAVHSFEPVPMTFEELKRNYDLIGQPKNVFINNLALGDRAEEVTINLFKDSPTGHASLSNHGRDDAISFKCQMITLDSYLEEKNINQINFIKADIEGAEMLLLKGAKKLLEQSIPPIFLMEIALNQTRNFGYLPNDLINFIKEKSEYNFYAVDEINGKLKKIEGFASEDIGANVFCFPKNFYQDRFNLVLEKFPLIND